VPLPAVLLDFISAWSHPVQDREARRYRRCRDDDGPGASRHARL